MKRYTLVLVCGEKVEDLSYCPVEVYLRRLACERFILCEDGLGGQVIVAVDTISYVDVEELDNAKSDV